jgi:hypothetical protein
MHNYVVISEDGGALYEVYDFEAIANVKKWLAGGYEVLEVSKDCAWGLTGRYVIRALHGNTVTEHGGDEPYIPAEELSSLERVEHRISLDNGRTFLSPDEAVQDERFNMEALAAVMIDCVRERVHSELAPCAEHEFLRRYLELAPHDLIIG